MVEKTKKNKEMLERIENLLGDAVSSFHETGQVSMENFFTEGEKILNDAVVEKHIANDQRFAILPNLIMPIEEYVRMQGILMKLCICQDMVRAFGPGLYKAIVTLRKLLENSKFSAEFPKGDIERVCETMPCGDRVND